MTQDGTTFYLNTFVEGMIKGSVDPKTGLILSYEFFHQHDDIGREVLLSDDERYLYTTEFASPNIGRFRIEPDRLVRLESDFVAEHIVTWLWRKDDLIVSGARNLRKASVFLIQENGGLLPGANTPFDVFSNSLSYADFSPSRDRVYFSGNTFLQAYDIGPNGLMTLAPNSGLQIDGISLGIAVAPEIRGDPYSLVFLQPQHDSEPFRIQGDPDTVFYLRQGDQCQGPFITDSSGFFETDIQRQPDLRIEILAYCDEMQVGDTLVTVPTLSPFGLMIFMSSMLVVALNKRQYVQNIANKNRNSEKLKTALEQRKMC
jgi:hypothetical protein